MTNPFDSAEKQAVKASKSAKFDLGEVVGVNEAENIVIVDLRSGEDSGPFPVSVPEDTAVPPKDSLVIIGYLKGDRKYLASTVTSPEGSTTPSSGLSISDDGTVVLDEATDLNAGTSIEAVDDGDGTATLNVTAAGGSAFSVSDDGALVVDEPTDINLGSNVTVSDDGDGTVTIDALLGNNLELLDSGSASSSGNITVTTSVTKTDFIPMSFVEVTNLGTTTGSVFVNEGSSNTVLSVPQWDGDNDTWKVSIVNNTGFTLDYNWYFYAIPKDPTSGSATGGTGSGGISQLKTRDSKTYETASVGLSDGAGGIYIDTTNMLVHRPVYDGTDSILHTYDISSFPSVTEHSTTFTSSEYFATKGGVSYTKDEENNVLFTTDGSDLHAIDTSTPGSATYLDLGISNLDPYYMTFIAQNDTTGHVYASSTGGTILHGIWDRVNNSFQAVTVKTSAGYTHGDITEMHSDESSIYVGSSLIDMYGVIDVPNDGSYDNLFGYSGRTSLPSDVPRSVRQSAQAVTSNYAWGATTKFDTSSSSFTVITRATIETESGSSGTETENWAWWGGTSDEILYKEKNEIVDNGVNIQATPATPRYDPTSGDVYVMGFNTLVRIDGETSQIKDHVTISGIDPGYKCLTIGHGAHSDKIFLVSFFNSEVHAYNKSDLSLAWFTNIGVDQWSILYTANERLYVSYDDSGPKVSEVDPATGSTLNTTSVTGNGSIIKLAANSNGDVITGREAYTPDLSTTQWSLATPSYGVYELEYHDVGKGDVMFLPQESGTAIDEQPKILKIDATNGSILDSINIGRGIAQDDGEGIIFTPEYAIIPQFRTRFVNIDAGITRMNYDLSVAFTTDNGTAFGVGVEGGRYSTWNHLPHWQ